MRRRTVIILILVAAAAAWVTPRWQGIWKWCVFTTVYEWGWIEDFPHRGQSTIVCEQRLRFGKGRHGNTVEHYWKSGFLARVTQYTRGKLVRSTIWRRDGSVKRQEWLAVTAGGRTRPRRRVEPPWEWGVEAQTAPTAPWWDVEQRRAMWWPETR